MELVDGANLHINWTFAGQHVGSYVLEILRYEGNTLRENRTVTVKQNFYVIENANLNSEYHFRVRAVSDTGDSTFTQQRTIQLRPEGVGLRGWHIALIVIFLVLAVLLCCILCCCIALLWRDRRRTYDAEKKGLCIAMNVCKQSNQYFVCLQVLLNYNVVVSVTLLFVPHIYRKGLC